MIVISEQNFTFLSVGKVSHRAKFELVKYHMTILEMTSLRVAWCGIKIGVHSHSDLIGQVGVGVGGGVKEEFYYVDCEGYVPITRSLVK